MNSDFIGDSFFEQIAAVLQIECSACGARNASRSPVCEACGVPLKQRESDPKSLSFLQVEGGVGAFSATWSGRLAPLRAVLDRVGSGEISKETYLESVSGHLAEIEAILVKLEPLKSVRHKFSPSAQDLLDEAFVNLEALVSACNRMLLYDGTNLVVAEEGYQMAVSAIEDMQATGQAAAEFGEN